MPLISKITFFRKSLFVDCLSSGKESHKCWAVLKPAWTCCTSGLPSIMCTQTQCLTNTTEMSPQDHLSGSITGNKYIHKGRRVRWLLLLLASKTSMKTLQDKLESLQTHPSFKRHTLVQELNILTAARMLKLKVLSVLFVLAEHWSLKTGNPNKDRGLLILNHTLIWWIPSETQSVPHILLPVACRNSKCLYVHFAFTPLSWLCITDFLFFCFPFLWKCCKLQPCTQL